MRLQQRILVLVISRIAGSYAVAARKGAKEDDCIDNISYETKMGMKCSEHSLFICEGLVSVGLLSGHELDELRQNCPISCRVPRCEKYLPPLRTDRRAEVDDAKIDEERDLLITFPSQDGDQCFVGWDPLCQDDPSYKSPLGNLTCSEYVDTQCVLFRHVGFNEAEMFDFINACPCSCGIECNTWTLPPTGIPTAAPTVSAKPSSSPTGSPTSSAAPSPMHSASPSSQPTGEACVVGWKNTCQDDPDYESSLGPCSSFSNYGCEAFQVIFTADEFFNLVTSCPCTCNVECGTYTKAPSSAPSEAPTGSPPVAVPITGTAFEVQMSPVANLMDPQASALFQNTLTAMTLQNLQLPTNDTDAQLSFPLFQQDDSTLSNVLSVNAQISATFTIPAKGPGEPDLTYAPTKEELDDAVAMIFALPGVNPQTAEFISTVQATSVLSSLTNVTYQITIPVS